MCGIYGVVRFDGAPVEGAELAPMGACLEHRGPDASGTWLEGGVGLGHRRLAIIDLSPSANQPMVDAGGDLVIVFNGEIYNFVEQRERLEAKGVRFRTRSDTEVILALYRERGMDCLAELRGMFAFALYDRSKRQLLLARDRAGQKPLFYCFDGGLDGGTFSFASEPKALFAGGRAQPRPDFDQLRRFLELGYVHGPRTAFEGVRSLAPGSVLIVTADGEPRERRYWALDYRVKEAHTAQAWAQRAGERLREAVRLRMVADVPLGAFLSGGLDSSAVVALMSAEQAGVKTFSIGFGDVDYDERRYARLVAERFETDHHEYVVQPELEEMLDVFVAHYDQPFGDPSAIPSLYLSRIARQEGGVTVVLNGDGADESFGGYERYRAQQLFEAAAAVPGARRFAPLHRLLPESARGGLLRKGKRFLQLLDGDGAAGRESYLRLVGQIPRELADGLIGDAWPRAGVDEAAGGPLDDLFEQAPPGGVDRLLYVDFHSYLPDDLLVKMDRASMAFSLEARSPFLDHVLLEEVARMPSELKLRGLRRGLGRGSGLKWVLRQAMRELLPAEVLKRPKMGFGVPLEHWFRGPSAGWLRETLLDGELVRADLLRREAVGDLIARHQQGGEDHANRLWVLVVLELWWRRFFVAGAA